MHLSDGITLLQWWGPGGLYQPFKHGTEELLNKHLLLIVVETGQLSPEGLAEEVRFHPGAFHQDLLVVEHLEKQRAPSADRDIYIHILCISSVIPTFFCTRKEWITKMTRQLFKSNVKHYIYMEKQMHFWKNPTMFIFLF